MGIQTLSSDEPKVKARSVATTRSEPPERQQEQGQTNPAVFCLIAQNEPDAGEASCREGGIIFPVQPHRSPDDKTNPGNPCNPVESGASA
jgi:hypothetical protein